MTCKLLVRVVRLLAFATAFFGFYSLPHFPRHFPCQFQQLEGHQMTWLSSTYRHDLMTRIVILSSRINDFSSKDSFLSIIDLDKLAYRTFAPTKSTGSFFGAHRPYSIFLGPRPICIPVVSATAPRPGPEKSALVWLWLWRLRSPVRPRNLQTLDSIAHTTPGVYGRSLAPSPDSGISLGSTAPTSFTPSVTDASRPLLDAAVDCLRQRSINMDLLPE
ncbi:hypothetical protein B0H12DRAFT_401514 [Mycena haematopus]|nr:hypothetical protein B0H12DRAFT_401514 [Mycena haematopus]